MDGISGKNGDRRLTKCQENFVLDTRTLTTTNLSKGVERSMVTNSQEIVEKAHLTCLTPLSGVVSAFLGKRSPIVEQMVKPLFFAFHKEICSGTFSTDSEEIAKGGSQLRGFYFNDLGVGSLACASC